MLNLPVIQTGASIFGGISALVGIVGLILAPSIGSTVFETLWGVEPVAYIGAVLVIAGLGLISLSYFITNTRFIRGHRAALKKYKSPHKTLRVCR